MNRFIKILSALSLSAILCFVVYIAFIPLPSDIVFYTQPTGYGGNRTAYKFSGRNSISCFHGFFTYDENLQKINENRPGGSHYNPENYPIKTKVLTTFQKIKILQLLDEIPEEKSFYSDANDWFYLADTYGTKRESSDDNEDVKNKAFETMVTFIVDKQEVFFCVTVPNRLEREAVSYGESSLINLMLAMIRFNEPHESFSGNLHKWISLWEGKVIFSFPTQVEGSVVLANH